MASIQEYLDLIKNAIYGKDVRQAIHDGIQQCYYDGKAGSTDLEARQRLDSAEGSISSLGSRMSTAEGNIADLDARVDQIVAPSGEAPSAAEVADGRIVDGVTYNLIGDAIRAVNTNLKSDLYDGVYNGYRFGSLNWEHGWVNPSGVYDSSDGRYLVQGMSTDDAIAVVNQSPNALFIVYFSSYTDLSNFTFDSRETLNVNKTFAIDKTKPYFLIESNATTVDGLVGVSLRMESSLKYLQHSNLGGIDFHSLVDKTGAITPAVNMLDGLTQTTDKIYERTTGNVVDNQYGNIYPAIPIKAGVTYYYKNLYGWFCVIKYSNGQNVNLTNDQSTTQSGSFTATYDGTICISTRKGKSGFVFTTSQELYNSELTNSFYIVDAIGIPKIYHVEKDGSGDFTSLVEAVEEATKYMDSVVYVGDGEWDLIDELGSAYIESVGSSKRGLYLKNRVHLIFSSKSVVKCIYTGSRADTIAWLSAFNAGVNGFTLENANIITGNIRYCVHDERDTDTDAYVNKYINCKMYHDSSYSQGGQNQCIGGGLGCDGYVEIDGCIFENPNVSNSSIVSYHNTSGSGKSNVNVKNCYLKGTNTLRFRYYGQSTDKSVIVCCGNSLGANIVTGAETPSSTIDNIELIAWNNEIR